MTRWYNYKRPEDDLRFEYTRKPTEDSLSRLARQHYFKALVVIGVIVAYDFYWYWQRYDLIIQQTTRSIR